MQIEVGMLLDGKVTKLAPFGAFVALPDNQSGLIHISEISAQFVKDIHDFVNEGSEVRVKVIGIDDKGRVNLSLKQAAPSVQSKRPTVEYQAKKPAGDSFEDMMSRFLSSSSDKMSDLKQRGEQPRRRRGY